MHKQVNKGSMHDGAHSFSSFFFRVKDRNLPGFSDTKVSSVARLPFDWFGALIP